MSRLLEGLNPQQAEAVRHHGRSLLILAGAGSGKTRVITHKIAYLIREVGYDPRSILAVTFTNKAAGEMRERAIALEPHAQEVMIRTFHSFGAWVLRRHGGCLGLSNRFTIYDDDDSVALGRTVYPDHDRRSITELVRAVSRYKDRGLTPADVEVDEAERSGGGRAVQPPRPGDTRSERVDFYRAYQNRLEEIGNADFGDLILRPLEILSRHPDEAAQLRRRFQVVLVDEYQDSNTAQYRMLGSLATESTYLCVVGDDDQSIYRFRGARVENILEFADVFSGTDVLRLEENYRSTAPILAVASDVVSKNRGRLGKTLFTRREGGSLPVFARLESQEEEVAYVLGLVRDGGDPGNTAILYRTNAQSRPFEAALIREGMPYRIVGTVRFYEREEVKDALALLKTRLNPRDEVSFRRIINKPARGIGKKTLDGILQGGPDLLGAARAAIPTASRKAAAGLRAFDECMTAMDEILRNAMGNLAEVVSRGLSLSGLRVHHADSDDVSGLQREQNLDELENAAALYPAGYEGLAEFLEATELDGGRESDDAPDAVTLITMHNTKGLEFDRVIITGLEDGLFPRRPDDQEELEEERRLFYVALTRARRSLFLTSAATRIIHGRWEQPAVSMFVREIDRTLIDIDEAVSEPIGDATDGLAPGKRVYHDDYGGGRITRAWEDGGIRWVLVRFDTGNVGQFAPRYTPLDPVADD